MAISLSGFVKGSINRISEHHLRRFHNQMALTSLKEHENNEKLTVEEKKAISSLWGPVGYKSHGEWHRLYKAVHGFDERFVPNDVYGLELLPRLNTTNLLPAWDDKAYYPRLFPDVKQPVAIAFVIDGLCYDNKYRFVDVHDLVHFILDNYTRIIIKPSDGLEGRGVEIVKVIDLDFDSLKAKLLSYGRNYVIQEVIEQHDSLAAYNISSVNPIRVMTLRLGGKIHFLHATLRFGSPGSHTDMSFVDGKEIGHVCAINKDGIVSKEWYDMDGKRTSFSDFGITRQEIIPNFNRIIETAIAVHSGLHHFDFVGFDFTVNKQQEPIMIEYNVYWPGIIIPQYCHGPLFGDLTEELLSELKNKPKK